MTWLAETVKRKTHWEAQLETVRTVIKEKGLTVDACLIAAATARGSFFEKCRQPTLALTPEQAYAAAVVKAVIAVSTSRTSVCPLFCFSVTTAAGPLL